jgi:hypothetical protein
MAGEEAGLFDQFEQAQEEQREEGALERIVRLANLMVEQKAAVEIRTEELRQAKEALLRTEREDLPQLLKELELTSIRLKDGSTVELKSEIDCAITEANRAAAHAWLQEHGFGGIIKTQLQVSFGKDEVEDALHLADEILASTGRHAAVGEAVHPSTLKSFVKEQLEAGNAIPFDLFSIRPYDKVKLIRGK